MSARSQLSFDEALWLGLLLVQLVGLGVWFWSRPHRSISWSQPPAILGVIFFYYAVFGPLLALRGGNWTDRGVDLRYAFLPSWQGATVAFASFLTGYAVIRQRLKSPRRGTQFQSELAVRVGRQLNVLGIVLFAANAGPRLLSMLNPFSVANVDEVATGLDFGPFANYAGLAINFLIPGTFLFTAACARQAPRLLELLGWFVVAAAIYTTLGFRYRLALLFAGMLLVWFLAKGRAPRAIVLIPTIIGLLAMAGFIGLTRNYGRGLDLTRVEDATGGEVLEAGFGESVIFLTSGAVMHLTPSVISYVGVKPLVNTLLYPIPSSFFPDKNSNDYLADATALVYNSDVHNQGSAFTNYAEYFLMGGWPVLIGGYLFLGWLYRRLWLWFRWRAQEPIAQVTYVCATVYLYVVVSRGYLPQVVMLFCFTVLPLFVFYHRTSRPLARGGSGRRPPIQVLQGRSKAKV